MKSAAVLGAIFSRLRHNATSMSASLWVVGAVVLFTRFQQVSKLSLPAPLALGLPALAALDLSLLGLAYLVLASLPKPRHVLWLFVLTVLLVFPVFFQVKVGLPLSLGLLSQIGGLFELKTSIADQSNLRSALLLGSLFFATIVALVVSSHARLRPRRHHLLLVFGLLLACCWGARLVLGKVAQVPGQSFLLSLTGGEALEERLSASKLLPKLGRARAQQLLPSSGPAKNLIVVLVETFDARLTLERARFERVMPWLAEHSQRAQRFEQHYAPWPFSSKALFSLVCGLYPYPGPVIDIRVRPTHPCGSWAQELQLQGVKTWAAYSGDRRYDHMGPFLGAQGFQHVEDRADLRRFSLEEFGLGVDDRALLMSLKEFVVGAQGAPFAALMIPINSHHPYWAPRAHAGVLADPFENSFRYQDLLLRELFEWLAEEKLLADTLVVVTGDHGRREGQELGAVIDQAPYHVPLYLWHPTLEPKSFSHPTSHVALKHAILTLLGKSGQVLAGQELYDAGPVLTIYDFEQTHYTLHTRADRFDFSLERDELLRNQRPCVPDSSVCATALERIAELLGQGVHQFRQSEARP